MALEEEGSPYQVMSAHGRSLLKSLPLRLPGMALVETDALTPVQKAGAQGRLGRNSLQRQIPGVALEETGAALEAVSRQSRRVPG